MNQSGVTVWFTGLSGAGKTTIAQAVERELRARRLAVELLDGDVVRQHLTRGLGFSREDRDENIRRISFVADLLTRNGVVVLVAAISPYRAIRDESRRRIGSFVEVYVNAPLEVCEQRDVKGLYRQARVGQLKHFTGIDDPYEPPLAPEVECCTHLESVDDSVARVLTMLEELGHLPAGPERPAEAGAGPERCAVRARRSDQHLTGAEPVVAANAGTEQAAG